jgi:hypothetical protein
LGHYEGSTNGRPLWARTFDETRVILKLNAADGANTAHFCPMREPKILLDDDHAGGQSLCSGKRRLRSIRGMLRKLTSRVKRAQGLREGTAEKTAVPDVEAMEIVRTRE